MVNRILKQWLSSVVLVQLLSHVRLFWPHRLQHARLLCPALSPRVCSSSCPLSQWLYLTISSSATLFSFCLQPFPASGSFPMSQLFTSGGWSIGASASASVLSIESKSRQDPPGSWVRLICGKTEDQSPSWTVFFPLCSFPVIQEVCFLILVFSCFCSGPIQII